MGFVCTKEQLNTLFATLSKDNLLYGPRVFAGEGEFSDTDSIRYGKIHEVDDLELKEKSSHTFKEILMPISETLFYYTEDSVQEAQAPNTQNAYVFLRSCDLHAVKRLDSIYMNNVYQDYYYHRLRQRVKFILIGCQKAFENCFCVDMGTNISTNYVASLDERDGFYHLDVKDEEISALLEKIGGISREVVPDAVFTTPTQVKLHQNIDPAILHQHSLWDEYDKRCIGCGRCNFSCPTCTCFTMQDIFYGDNPRSGERRRVWASCMVDGYTDVAGGGAYRKAHGARMRFKVMHKIHDYKKRFGDTHMCTGCGRCDDVCPEYISFSNAINKVYQAMEDSKND